MGIEGVKVPALIERPLQKVDRGAGRANLGVTWNDYASALDGAAHGHAEPRVDHRRAMLKVAAGAHKGRLGV